MRVFNEARFPGGVLGMRWCSLKCDSCLEQKRYRQAPPKKYKKCLCDILSPEDIKCLPVDSCGREISTTPFFFEQVDGKSLSSTFTEGRLHFILQKNERLAPEQSLDGPGVMSVFTGRPAANTQQLTIKNTLAKQRRRRKPGRGRKT